MKLKTSATLVAGAGLTAGWVVLCWSAGRTLGGWLAELTEAMREGVIPELPSGGETR